MSTYLFRNRHDKVVRGSISAKSVYELFNKVDDTSDPFSFEFCESKNDVIWLDEFSTWWIFKPMANFHIPPSLIPSE